MVDIVPNEILKSAIQSVATRINYGISLEDAKNFLKSTESDEDIKAVPNGLNVWRWEVKERNEMLPEEFRENLEKRFELRKNVSEWALVKSFENLMGTCFIYSYMKKF